MHVLKPLARSGVGCKLAAASDVADGAQMLGGGCWAELATGKAIAGGGVALKGHVIGQHGGTHWGRFGGSEAMNAAANSYFSGFYTEAEQVDTVLRRLGDRFEDLGLAMPESREG
ncbi:hypothetical protein N1037_11835 [Phaeobacter sp. G2]|nr:hypothetical protein N1037_11835 [Phaeobacter sp. G2]